MCVPDVFAYCLETTFVFWVVVVLSLLKINLCDLSIKGTFVRRFCIQNIFIINPCSHH